MLYLVQHGHAMDKEEDPDRPLTERGSEEVQTVAEVARRLRIDVRRILHSGKLRARQTAEIFSERLGADLEEQSFLKAAEDPRTAADYADDGVMIVGHKPHLPKLTSLLVGGDSDRDLVDFRNGGIVALDRKDGAWRIAWILTPEMAAALRS